MKVLSLCPSTTELVFALDRGSLLCGITKYCVRPPAGVRRITKLGGTKSPEIGTIVRLAPDLVLLNEEENRREDADALRRAGLRIASWFPRDVIGTLEQVRDLGRLLDARAASQRICRDIEQATAEIEGRARSREKRVKFAYLIWRKPYMAVAEDTYIHSILHLAGGENVFEGETGRYPELVPEALAARGPDRVFLSSEPFPFVDAHAEELSELSGLDRARFKLVDGQLLSWHGARTAEAIRYSESILFGADAR